MLDAPSFSRFSVNTYTGFSPVSNKYQWDFSLTMMPVGDVLRTGCPAVIESDQVSQLMDKCTSHQTRCLAFKWPDWTPTALDILIQRFIGVWQGILVVFYNGLPQKALFINFFKKFTLTLNSCCVECVTLILMHTTSFLYRWISRWTMIGPSADFSPAAIQSLQTPHLSAVSFLAICRAISEQF